MARKYAWWGFVKSMIRLYPERCAYLRQLQSARITPNYAPSARGSEISRTTETLATASLGAPVDKEIEAVRLAIEHTQTLKDADKRLKIIDLVYWKRSHTLTGACMEVGVGERTGQQMHADFIYDVSRYRELWTPCVKNTETRATVVPDEVPEGVRE